MGRRQSSIPPEHVRTIRGALRAQRRAAERERVATAQLHNAVRTAAAAGASLRALANEVGLTFQRIQQIVRSEGVVTEKAAPYGDRINCAVAGCAREGTVRIRVQKERALRLEMDDDEKAIVCREHLIELGTDGDVEVELEPFMDKLAREDEDQRSAGERTKRASQ